MFKALIIEDEPSSKSLLEMFLSNYCNDVKIVGDAETVKESIELIKTKKPDLLFLDIELKDGVGLDILNHFKHNDFVTIFITGYNSYSIEAIKKGATDYILKPIVIKELKEAVDKAKKRLLELKIIDNLNKEKFISKNFEGKIIVTNIKGELEFINPNSILYIENYSQYLKIIIVDGSYMLHKSTLSRFSSLLPDYFFKIHKSYIANLMFVDKIDNGRGGNIQIGSKKLPIAYRRKKQLLDKLKSL